MEKRGAEGVNRYVFWVSNNGKSTIHYTLYNLLYYLQ